MAATSKVSMKLLVDKNAQKVLFAEAGKDTVDFLFDILSLPVGTVIRLLTKSQMVGSVGNLYESVECLSEDYIQPNRNKDDLLKPKTTTGMPSCFLLKLNTIESSSPDTKNFYKCATQSSCGCNSSPYKPCSPFTFPAFQVSYLSNHRGTTCPRCKNAMTKQMAYVDGSDHEETSKESGVGFVKEVVTYMVMNNLVIKPMSTISGITLLTKFNVTDVALLEEMTVNLDVDTGLKLLKESFISEDVLTRVFLGSKRTRNM